MLILPNLDVLSQKHLSFEALDVLSAMINDISCDYCTLDILLKKITKCNESTLMKNLSELMEKKFVIKIGNKYAVNKAVLVSAFAIA